MVIPGKSKQEINIFYYLWIGIAVILFIIGIIFFPNQLLIILTIIIIVIFVALLNRITRIVELLEEIAQKNESRKE